MFKGRYQYQYFIFYFEIHKWELDITQSVETSSYLWVDSGQSRINTQASNLGKIEARPVWPWMLLSFSGQQGQYIYWASRPVWKFYSVAILKFQITFELPWENKNIQNSNNILKNAKWNYSYHSYMYRNYLLRGVFLYVKL
jgi:hypothetical protein